MNTESGIERDRVQATLQFNTAQVPITQVEHRSAEEINQERVEQFLANGSVSSSVQSTYRPNSTTKPYRFDPFEQFALAHDKRPYQKDWNQNLMNGAMVSVALERSPKANGVVGIIPDGYVVLDFDGPKAWDCFWLKRGIDPGDVYPASTIWYSGDPRKGGLPKVIYRLPEGLTFPRKKLIEKHWDGNIVELLGPGHPVTLPGSFYSEERGYYQEEGRYPIAPLPDCVIELIEGKITERQERFNRANLQEVSEGERSVEQLLARLDADDYDLWIEVGLSLKAMGDEYFDEFDQWSSTGRKYRGFREIEKKWDSFHPTKIRNGYAHLCRLAGVTPPALTHKAEELSPHEQRKRRAAENWVPLLSSMGDSQRQFFGDALADTISNTKLGDRKLIAQAGPPGKGKSVSLQAASKTAQRRGYERSGFSYLETASKGMAQDMGIAYRKSNESGSTEFIACVAALIPDANGADWDTLAGMDVSRLTAFDEASEAAQEFSGYRYDARIKRGNAEKIFSHTDIGVIQSATIKPYDVDFYRNIGGFKADEVVIDAISPAPHSRNIYIHPPTPPKGINNKLVAIHQVLELAKTARENNIAIALTCNSQKPTSDWGDISYRTLPTKSARRSR